MSLKCLDSTYTRMYLIDSECNYQLWPKMWHSAGNRGLHCNLQTPLSICFKLMGMGAWVEGETQDHWFNNVICWDPLHTRVAVAHLVHPPCSPLLSHLLNSYSFCKAQLKCSPSLMIFYLLQMEEILPTLETLWLLLSRAVIPKDRPADWF